MSLSWAYFGVAASGSDVVDCCDLVCFRVDPLTAVVGDDEDETEVDFYLYCWSEFDLSFCDEAENDGEETHWRRTMTLIQF